MITKLQIYRWIKNFIIFSIVLIFFSNCDKKEIIDPFWEINLNWNKEVTSSKLQEYSKSGIITDCVFSFDKEFYVQNHVFDAKVTSSLQKPVFSRNKLKKLNYSLIVEFRNEFYCQFNPDFYKYFKNKMVKNYGKNYKEKYEDDKIIIYWNINNEKTLTTTIIKEINHYIISFTNNG